MASHFGQPYDLVLITKYSGGIIQTEARITGQDVSILTLIELIRHAMYVLSIIIISELCIVVGNSGQGESEGERRDKAWGVADNMTKFCASQIPAMNS